tara:strand:- start:980 stop:1243 length:264 start_codon:yes stop_codon:yes gene_type:complete
MNYTLPTFEMFDHGKKLQEYKVLNKPSVCAKYALPHISSAECLSWQPDLKVRRRYRLAFTQPDNTDECSHNLKLRKGIESLSSQTGF